MQGDVPRLSFWWSNLVQLRWMFWAMCRGDQANGGDNELRLQEYDWIMQVGEAGKGCQGQTRGGFG